MSNPLTVEKFGSDLLVRMSDNSRHRAISSTGDMWIVSEYTAPPPPPPPDPPAGNRFVWPFTLDQVTSEYGQRWGRLHAGIDFGRGISNIQGTPIHSAASGTVVVANTTNSHGGYGNAVVVDHGGGLHTLYGHMAPGTVNVSVGQVVGQWHVLGGCGKTGQSYGVHLHFETHEGGYRWDASSRNPRTFFEKWNAL